MQGGHLQAEPAGLVRHARQRVGVVRRRSRRQDQRGLASGVPGRQLASTTPGAAGRRSARAVPPSYRDNNLGLRLARVPVGKEIVASTAAKQPADRRPKPPPTFKNSLGMEFVLVPKGKSWLGGGGGKPGDKEVEIKDDFYLGKYEVTQEEWEKVMGQQSQHFSRTEAARMRSKDIPDADLKRFPVETVSWDDAQLFLGQLNKQDEGSGLGVSLADGGGMGVCLPGRTDGGQVRERVRLLLREADEQLLPEQANFEHEQRPEADLQGGQLSSRIAGLVRHARQRLGVVRR